MQAFALPQIKGNLLEGLHDELRPGRPRTYEDDKVAERDVHLIVDNDCTHRHAKVRAWLAQRPRFHVHYTPTYASWLNQVERWFGLIT